MAQSTLDRWFSKAPKAAETPRDEATEGAKAGTCIADLEGLEEFSFDSEDDDLVWNVTAANLTKGAAASGSAGPATDSLSRPSQAVRSESRLLASDGTASGPHVQNTDSLLSGETVGSCARQICENLRKRILSNQTAARYRDFFRRHSNEKLFGLFRECTAKHIWTNCVEGRRALDPEYLDSLAEDYDTSQPGWYLIFLCHRLEPQRWHDYVGQALNVGSRGAGHLKSALEKPKPPLLYYTWRGGRNDPVEGSLDKLPFKAKICRLGTDRSGFGGKDKGLFLNLMEQFLALVFQTLQSKDLMEWLPREVKIQSGHGLNVALPVHQGHRRGSDIAGRTNQLLRSTDPIKQAFALSKLVERVRKACDPPAAREPVKQDDSSEDESSEQDSSEDSSATEEPVEKAPGRSRFLDRVDQISEEARQSGSYSNIFRDFQSGDVASVVTECRACGFERVDEQPRYLRVSGQYVVRRLKCHECTLANALRPELARQTAQVLFFPANLEDDQWVSYEWVLTRIRTDVDWALYFLGEGPQPEHGRPKPGLPRRLKPMRAPLSELQLPPVIPKPKEQKKWTSEKRPYKCERLGVLIQDSLPVRVKCSSCGWERDDVSPEYVLVTCEYAAKLQVCFGEQCRKKDGKGRTIQFEPVDPSIPWLTLITVANRIEKHAAREAWWRYYSGESPHSPDDGPPPAKRQRTS